MALRSRTLLVKRARGDRSRSRSRAPTRRRLAFPRRTLALVSRAVGLGTSANTVLRTSFFYNATASAAGVYTGYLKPGSCFDPCGDTAAVQPQMFDQFAAQYNRYKVNSCTIRIKITGVVSTSFAPVWVAAGYPAVDPTALTTYQAAASQQYAKTTSGGFQYLGTGSGSGAEGKTMTFKLNHNAIVGSKSDTWDIGALVTADPTALQYMVLPIFLQGSGAVACTWVLEIDIFQNVTFSQKKNVVDA